jgi:hypothetical protein
VLHWDGKSWTPVPSANGPLQYNALNALAFVPGSDEIWGVGWQSSGFGYTSLAIRFDGTTSAYTPTPGGDSFMYGVTATSADRALAVGYGDGQNPVFLRWNGSSWARSTVDAAGHNGILRAIVRVGSTLWVTGFADTQQGGALFVRRQ